MFIETKQQLNTLYAILTLSKSNRVVCEYFSEYPDAKLATLMATDLANLAEEGILAYAVCKFVDPIWEIETIVGQDSLTRRVLVDYVRKTLNGNFTK